MWSTTSGVGREPKKPSRLLQIRALEVDDDMPAQRRDLLRDGGQVFLGGGTDQALEEVEPHAPHTASSSLRSSRLGDIRTDGGDTARPATGGLDGVDHGAVVRAVAGCLHDDVAADAQVVAEGEKLLLARVARGVLALGRERELVRPGRRRGSGRPRPRAGVRSAAWRGCGTSPASPGSWRTLRSWALLVGSGSTSVDVLQAGGLKRGRIEETAGRFRRHRQRMRRGRRPPRRCRPSSRPTTTSPGLTSALAPMEDADQAQGDLDRARGVDRPARTGKSILWGAVTAPRRSPGRCRRGRGARWRAGRRRSRPRFRWCTRPRRRRRVPAVACHVHHPVVAGLQQHGDGRAAEPGGGARGTSVGRRPTASSNRHVPLRADGACRP